MPGRHTLDPGSSRTSQKDDSVQRADAIGPVPEGTEPGPKDTIRAHFAQVRSQYSVSKEQPRIKKNARYRGGKALYRSIERPLNVYTRGMDVIDVTDPEYKRDAKRLRQLQRMFLRQQAHDDATLRQQFHFKARYPQPHQKSKDKSESGSTGPNHSVIFLHSSHLGAAGMKPSPRKVALDRPLFEPKGATDAAHKAPPYKTINIVAEGDEDKHADGEVVFEDKPSPLAGP